MEKLLVTIYILVFLIFCVYIWRYLNNDGSNMRRMPKIGTKNYYQRKYLYHTRMKTKHAKKARKAYSKYRKMSSKRGWWR